MLRPELEPLPSRMKFLPLDHRGYVVPWFVAMIDGKPEFRAMDGAKWNRAIRERRCWVCGQTMGQYLAFVIGSMCAVNRVTSEPACHLECAEWSARNCPFLSRPHMVRREDGEINTERLIAESAGKALARNPGVAVVWVTREFKVFDAGRGKPLINLGAPISVRWYTHGRRATRAEAEAAVREGVPILQGEAEREDRERPGAGAIAALAEWIQRVEPLYPAL